MDYRYYLLIGGAIILGLIFIKKLWKLAISFVVIAGLYWYFFVK
ncbi:MAG: hypothetical protein AAB563_01395 [Patescibacteria group bacterium]